MPRSNLRLYGVTHHKSYIKMSGETILLVDDNAPMVLLLKKKLLEPLGYRVLIAWDGRQGVELALQEQPDLILLDMNMPQMTGLEMLTVLRQTACTAPVIFMTAESSLPIAVEAFRLGVRNYISKPFSLDEVEQAINQALEEKRLRLKNEAMQQNLLKANTIQQTIVTLSHYMNNDLMALELNLQMLAENPDKDTAEAQQHLDESWLCLKRIQAVMGVLHDITDVKLAAYYESLSMIDIEAALKAALAK
jgi:CheY-like chemotaxis protein